MTLLVEKILQDHIYSSSREALNVKNRYFFYSFKATVTGNKKKCKLSIISLRASYKTGNCKTVYKEIVCT